MKEKIRAAATKARSKITEPSFLLSQESFAELKDHITTNATILEFVSDLEKGFQWRRFLILALDVLGNALTVILVREIAHLDTASISERIQMSVLVITSILSILGSAAVANNQEKKEQDALELLLSHMEDDIEAQQTGLSQKISSERRIISAVPAANRLVRHAPWYRLPITVLHISNLIHLFPELAYSGMLTLALGFAQLRNAYSFSKKNTDLENSRLKLISLSKKKQHDTELASEHKKTRRLLEWLIHKINTINQLGALPLFIQSFFSSPEILTTVAASTLYQTTASLLANKPIQDAYANTISTHFAISQGRNGREKFENIVDEFLSFSYFIRTFQQLELFLKQNSEHFQEAEEKIKTTYIAGIYLEKIHTTTLDGVTITAPTTGHISFDEGPIAISGATGSGKTTLLLTLLGRLKQSSGGFCYQFSDKTQINPLDFKSIADRDKTLMLVDSKKFAFGSESFVHALVSAHPTLLALGTKTELEYFLRAVIPQLDIFRPEEIVLLFEDQRPINSMSRGQAERSILSIHIIAALFSNQNHLIIGCDEPLSALDEGETQQKVLQLLKKLHGPQLKHLFSFSNQSNNPFMNLCQQSCKDKSVAIMLTVQNEQNKEDGMGSPLTTIQISNSEILNRSNQTTLKSELDATSINQAEKEIKKIRSLFSLRDLLGTDTPIPWEKILPIIIQLSDDFVQIMSDKNRKELVLEQCLALSSPELKNVSCSLLHQLDLLEKEVIKTLTKLEPLNKKQLNQLKLTVKQKKSHELLTQNLEDILQEYSHTIDSVLLFASNFTKIPQLAPQRINIEHYIYSILKAKIVQLKKLLTYDGFFTERKRKSLTIDLKLFLTKIQQSLYFGSTNITIHSQQTSNDLRTFIDRGPLRFFKDVVANTKQPGRYLVCLNQQYYHERNPSFLEEIPQSIPNSQFIDWQSYLADTPNPNHQNDIILIDLSSTSKTKVPFDTWNEILGKTSIDIAKHNKTIFIFVNTIRSVPPNRSAFDDIFSIRLPESVFKKMDDPNMIYTPPLALFPEYESYFDEPTTHGNILKRQLLVHAQTKYSFTSERALVYQFDSELSQKIISAYFKHYRPDFSQIEIMQKVANEFEADIKKVSTTNPYMFTLFTLSDFFGPSETAILFKELVDIPLDISLIYGTNWDNY